MKIKLLLIISIILIFAFSLSPAYFLEVRVNGTEELVYQQKARLGDYFDIKWIHSVTLQPVIETYCLEALGRIPIVKMTFNEFGPNLPAHPEFNQYWIIEDGKYNVLGYELVFDRVPVTIGSVISDHILIYNGKTIHLKDVYKPGGYVHIGLNRKTLLQFFIEEVKTCQTSIMRIITK